MCFFLLDDGPYFVSWMFIIFGYSTSCAGEPYKTKTKTKKKQICGRYLWTVRNFLVVALSAWLNQVAMPHVYSLPLLLAFSLSWKRRWILPMQMQFDIGKNRTKWRNANIQRFFTWILRTFFLYVFEANKTKMRQQIVLDFDSLRR